MTSASDIPKPPEAGSKNLTGANEVPTPHDTGEGRDHVEAAQAQTAKPTLAEPARRLAEDDFPDQSPEMQAEMDRAMRGEPAPEHRQLEDWPLPDPQDVTPANPVTHHGELQGDAPAVE